MFLQRAWSCGNFCLSGSAFLLGSIKKQPGEYLTKALPYTHTPVCLTVLAEDESTVFCMADDDEDYSNKLGSINAVDYPQTNGL